MDIKLASRLDDLAFSLGVDRIEYDHSATMSRGPSEGIRTGHGGALFYAPFMVWWIGEQKFYGLVPVKVRRMMRGGWGREDRYDYDYDAMELAFCKMVRDSKRGIVEYR